VFRQQHQCCFLVLDEWHPAQEYSGFPGTQEKRYSVSIDILVPDCRSFEIYGSLFFYAIWQSSPVGGKSEPGYKLKGICDMTWSRGRTVESDSFCELIAEYLPAGLPRAKLAEEGGNGLTTAEFTIDASGSTCGGFGLHAEPFRWLISSQPDWTDWSAAPSLDVTFTEPGRHVVTLEVRNTVGWTSQDEAEYEIFAAEPGSFEELLETFAMGTGRKTPPWLPVV